MVPRRLDEGRADDRHDGGKSSSSDQLESWSLTLMHEELQQRYPLLQLTNGDEPTSDAQISRTGMLEDQAFGL